jgi:hypothetical protein
MAGKRIDAIAYLRTSSAANVGSDKDSDKRQRAAIASFAKAHGYRIVDEFYDAAVSGADPVTERPGFKAMLDRIAGNGVRVILVESPDRFARDLSVQITGHAYLRSLGVELVPTSAPDTASRPGMSGSPVILRTYGTHISGGGITLTTGPANKFIGVYSGRLYTQDPLRRPDRNGLAGHLHRRDHRRRYRGHPSHQCGVQRPI